MHGWRRCNGGWWRGYCNLTGVSGMLNRGRSWCSHGCWSHSRGSWGGRRLHSHLDWVLALCWNHKNINFGHRISNMLFLQQGFHKELTIGLYNYYYIDCNSKVNFITLYPTQHRVHLIDDLWAHQLNTEVKCYAKPTWKHRLLLYSHWRPHLVWGHIEGLCQLLVSTLTLCRDT